ncbi:hypothetical protein [Morganella psychrotolerans]|uniref:Uncharacterized protein n=1 Tax=Morganella psychrotolerans TaxID=368603 RepID=A0A1B8H6Z9_9GAMM|nr:hypothetical protein [Morganella psychrotolerans]OBU04852.1 hypothetical protein AYY17_08125 [Morganella psychrotolerans]
MKNTAMALIALAVSFSAGWWTGGVLYDNRQMKGQITGQQLDEKDMATNIELRHQADDHQQVNVGEYQEGKKSDTIRTEALLDRVLNHFDRMQQPAGTTKAEVADPGYTDTCRTERDKAGELSRQLRSTLERYGREAQRADENTRLLNLCIIDLKAKEKLLESYR